jgi:hypothetical protein
VQSLLEAGLYLTPAPELACLQVKLVQRPNTSKSCWVCDLIAITVQRSNTGSGSEQIFFNGPIELTPAHPCAVLQASNTNQMAAYELCLWTSNLAHAGTDAPLSVKLCGHNRDSALLPVWCFAPTCQFAGMQWQHHACQSRARINVLATSADLT